MRAVRDITAHTMGESHLVKCGPGGVSKDGVKGPHTEQLTIKRGQRSE